ncbi:hypothetical protein Golomagni_06854 [Golovinomyces magnicellulatus]|nr:hypothetical protein Golomagni_06854 [Golovinomyces magnicellulatus]
MYDALIIGGGPAGLAIAASAVRQDLSIAMIDSGEYRNAKAKHMHMMLGWDHQDPAVFRAKARSDLQSKYPKFEYIQGKVDSVTKTADGHFEAVLADGKALQGKKLGLATGVRDVTEKQASGYDDCYGNGIIHCLFCHGYEERGDRAGVLLGGMVKGPMAQGVAQMAKKLAGAVTVYTNGEEFEYPGKSSKITVDKREIERFDLVDGGPKVRVTFKDGSSVVEGFVASHPEVVPRSGFATQLGLEMTPMGDVKVGMFGETNVRGCFAAGDAATMMKSAVIAQQLGACAGVGIVKELLEDLDDVDEFLTIEA